MAGGWKCGRLMFTEGLCKGDDNPSGFSIIESVSRLLIYHIANHGIASYPVGEVVNENYCLPIALLSKFEDGGSRFLRNKVNFCEIIPRHFPRGSHRHDRLITHKAYRLLV
jgi:hypothetical protein